MARPNKFWTIRAAEDAPDIAELLLYGEISDVTWWGDEVTPKQFKADLDALGNVREIRVYINSIGGDVFAGQAIYSMLKRHQSRVSVYVDGLAASIASVVAMAGDVVYMPRNAMMMLHNPWSLAVGNAAVFRKMADDLDKIRESMVAAYQDKSGLDRDQIIELMDAETWLTAEEAVKFGFVDEIEEAKQVAASLAGGRLVINGQVCDLRRFRNPPDLAVFAPVVRAGVVPRDVSRETAPEDEEWEAPTLSDFTDKRWEDLSDAERQRIAGHYTWAAEMPPPTFGDLKLPHHRASDGAVVWRGVANAAVRLPQSDIPDEDIGDVQAHLGSHYRQFGRTPPWEEQEDAWREFVKISRIMRDSADLDPDLAARWVAVCQSLFPEIRGEGRVLSTANERRIRQARDLLDEVLEQLAMEDEAAEESQGETNNNPVAQRQAPLSTYEALIKANRNQLRR